MNCQVRKLCTRFVMMLTVVSGVSSFFKGHAQEADLKRNIVTFGVPSIPPSLIREVEPYMDMYGLQLADWDPETREIWLKGMSSVAWISGVKSPGATPKTSIYIRAGDVYDLYIQPQRKSLVYARDNNGSELFQLYLYEIGSGRSTLLSDNKSRNTEPVWSNDGKKVVYSSTPIGASGVNLRLVDPLERKSDRLLVQSSGGYLKAFDWSPDDSHLVVADFSANTISTLWLVEIATGKRELLSPTSTSPEFYDAPQFSKDGKGVYVVTDHDSEFRRLAHIELSSRKLTYLSGLGESDVEEFQVSPDGVSIAFTTNEKGTSRLHVLNLRDKKELVVPPLPNGVISDLKWHSNSTELAFNLKSPQNPNEVYSVKPESGSIQLWSKGITNELATKSFVVPDLIQWTSFDKKTISGFLYRPPPRFTGKRPVIIDIHGGPEEQFRPGFLYTDNYLVNELGVAKLYPNVRGSSGYGRTFLNLDNGLKREDSLKDIGALLDWIRAQPDLDSDRVLVEGASYGGYLALSAAYTYSDRIRGMISDSGISNLATFVERTEGWRRGLQRAEFGDEREPKMKEFMEHAAPVNNAGKIRKPLLIIQGLNDPRVPVAEAERIVTATKSRVPVWYLLAKDEGHGFSQPNNRNYQLYTTILFIKQFLLK